MRLLVHARSRTIASDDGRICAPEGKFDVVVQCPDADVRPGLINSHDHLHRNHYGRLGRPTYPNAAQWASDIQHRYRRRIAKGRTLPRRQAHLIGAWKNLFAGVTSVVHHDSWDEQFETEFPLRVVRVANDDSATIAAESGGGRSSGPRCVHVAEGTDERAATDVLTLDRAGLLGPNLFAVHAVGPGEEGCVLLRRSGATLVWCPSSNYFLFNRTMPKSLFGGDNEIVLGSDSLLTGTGNLLDELRFGRSLGRLDDERLEQSVGPTAARRLGLPAPELEPGAPADFFLVAAPLLEASATHVQLVVAAGVPRVAAADVARQLEAGGLRGRRLTIGRVTRWANPGSTIQEGCE